MDQTKKGGKSRSRAAAGGADMFQLLMRGQEEIALMNCVSAYCV